MDGLTLREGRKMLSYDVDTHKALRDGYINLYVVMVDVLIMTLLGTNMREPLVKLENKNIKNDRSRFFHALTKPHDTISNVAKTKPYLEPRTPNKPQTLNHKP